MDSHKRGVQAKDWVGVCGSAMKRLRSIGSGIGSPAKKGKTSAATLTTTTTTPVRLISAHFTSEDGECQLIIFPEEYARKTSVLLHEDEDTMITLYDTQVLWRDVGLYATGIASHSLEFFSATSDLHRSWTEAKDEEWRTSVVAMCREENPNHLITSATHWAVTCGREGICSGEMGYKTTSLDECIVEMFFLTAYC